MTTSIVTPVIPEHLLDLEHLASKLGEEPQILHNWLYSVVPADIETTIYEPEGQKKVFAAQIYLAGYCRACNNAFTVPLQYGTQLYQQQLDIPKIGCKPSA